MPKETDKKEILSIFFVIFISIFFIFLIFRSNKSLDQVLEREPFLFNKNLKKAPFLEEWKISREEALNMVAQLPEVDKFLKRGVVKEEDEYGIIVYRPVVDTGFDGDLPSRSNPFWTIHVWDDVTDYAKDGVVSGHSATFGWYRVHAQTGEIIKGP